MGTGISDVIFSAPFAIILFQQPDEHHDPDSEFGRKEMEMGSLPSPFGTKLHKTIYLVLVKVSEKLIQKSLPGTRAFSI